MWRLLLRVFPFILLALFLTHRTASAQVAVSLPDVQVAAGATELIPINVGDLSGHDITSFEFTISYDPTIVEITGVSSAGTLTGATVPIVNTTTSGEVSIAWADAFALSGAGVLLNLQASFLQEGSSALNFESFRFNEGEPASSTTNGQVTVGTGSTGSVNVSLPASSSGTVGGSQLSIPISVNDVTGKGITSYSFTLVYDAAIIDVASFSTAGTMSSGAAPTINTGTAGQITVTWTHGVVLAGSGVLGNLLVTPVASGISTLTLATIQFNSGDPTANVTNGSVTVQESGQIAVSIPTGIVGEIGDQVIIPVNTGDLTGENVLSYVFTLAYNSDDLTINGANVTGTLSAGNTVIVNTDLPGQIVVSLTAAAALSGSGVLVNLDAELTGPGTSALSFSSFQYNAGSPSVATVDGSVTVQGFATYIQLVHNSSDAPAVDIYLNDVRQVDALSYGSATAFLELTSPIVKLDVVRNDASNNASPIISTNVSLESDKDYVAVINGLYTGSGKQAIGLVVQDSQQESSDENTVGLNVFQGSPDAPPINAYIVDDTESYNRILTLAKGLSFGDAFLAREFEPGLYNIEITQNSGDRIGIYRADLSRTGGAALLFIIQGFVNPIIGQPDLSITAYAPDGRAIFLPLATDNEDEFALPNAFGLEGNYPNPFNPTTSVEFNLPEPADVSVDVFDMLGRHVLSAPAQPFQAGARHAIQLDASALSSGTYVYRIVAHGHQQSYTESKTMTLLK